jgi:eukaryotic-like serine/threonine-protein kinase
LTFEFVLDGRHERIGLVTMEVEAVNAFLTEDLLGQADPDANARDKQVTVEELLRKASAKIDGNPKLAGRPEVEATLRLTLGKTFFKLSDLNEAEKHLRQAVDLRRKVFGPDDPRTLTAQEALADFLNRGPERVAESVPLARQTWEARARVLGSEHRDTLDSMDTYAMSLATSGQLDRAILLLRECLAARRRVLGENHSDTISAMGNLAFGLGKRGEWPEAISLERRVIEGRRGTSGEEAHPRDVSLLATFLYIVGDLEEGERLLEEAVVRATRRLGVDHRETDRLRWIQIRFWIDQGQLERAETVGREELARRRRIFPSLIAPALMDSGRCLILLRKFEEAEAPLAESVTLFAKANSGMPHHPAWAECWYGASLTELRRYAQAEPHLLAAEKGLSQAPTCPRRHYRQAVEQLVKLYNAWGKPDQANVWRKKLNATVDAARNGSLN